MRLSLRVLMSSSAARGSRVNLAGIFPPIPTPFKPGDPSSISYEHLAQNFRKWSDKGFAGYVLMGSNGEFVYLTNEEKRDLVKAARSHIPKHQLLIAGAGCESTSATIEMCRSMKKAGADAVLVHTPCFYKKLMSPAVLHQHYSMVADASPLPVILYNVPPNTQIDMSAEIVVGLSDHPNIIGLKDSSGNVEKIGEIVKATKKAQGDDFQVLAGSAGFLLKALQNGSVGGVCAAANVLGAECVDLVKLCESGKTEEAEALQKRLVAPNAAITAGHGIPALKHMMERKGFYGGPVRPPLLPLNPTAIDEVEQTFSENGFL